MKKLAILISITCSLSASAQVSAPSVKCITEQYDACPTSGPASYNCAHVIKYRVVCKIVKASATAAEASALARDMQDILGSRWGY